MINRMLFGMVLMLFSAEQVFSQESQVRTLSLKDAVEFAKKNNYQLKNNKLDVEAARKKVNEVFSYGLPQISASGNIISNVQIPVQVIPNFTGQGPSTLELKFGRPFTSNVTVSGNQLLFDGTFLLGVKASQEFVNLSQLNYSRNNIETEVNVSKAYYLVLLLEANENFMNRNIATLQKTKSDLEQFHLNGFTEKVDVDRISLQLSNLMLQKDKIHDQKQVAKLILKLQMGMSMTDSIVLTDELEKLYETSRLSAIEDKVDYGNRIEYKMLKQQLSLNELDRKRYLIGYAPSLYLFANHQRNAFADELPDLYTKMYPGTSVGLSMTLPIFDGLRKHAQTQQANISIMKTENDMRNFENVINQQVYQSKANFVRSSQQLEIQRNNLKLAQDIYEKMEVKYKNGVGSSLELTTAQNDLENARTNLLTTIYEYFSAELELKKALGIIQ